MIRDHVTPPARSGVLSVNSTEPTSASSISRGTMSENSRRSVFLCSLPALILSAACLLPYLNKAFVIDDPVFLLQAQQIRKEPLHPLALYICWTEDKECGPVAHSMPGNVLMSYYLVPVANL